MQQSIIDYLEELYDLCQPVQLRFWADNGGLSSVQGRIVKLSTEGAEAALETDGGLYIPLHRLTYVNNVAVSPTA